MTPPDSGEREAMADKLRAMHSHEGYCPHCDPKYDRSKCWFCNPPTKLVSLPLSLAQRILAVLDRAAEGHVTGAFDIRALAAELRERLPK